MRNLARNFAGVQAVSVCIVIGIAALAVSLGRPQQAKTSQSQGSVLLVDRFDGVQAPMSDLDPVWEVEGSGDVHRRDNELWIDHEMVRIMTDRAGFLDHGVSMRLKNRGFQAGTADRPRVPWDGVKIFLRRQLPTFPSPKYVAEVNLRDGRVRVQKKCRGSYIRWEIVAQTNAKSWPAKIGIWETVGATIRNHSDGSVRINVLRSGKVALRAADRGVGCPPIRQPGRTGLRSDNVSLQVDDFIVSANPAQRMKR